MGGVRGRLDRVRKGSPGAIGLGTLGKDMTVEQALKGLDEAVAALGEKPTLTRASRVCAASQIAWGVCYDSWLLREGESHRIRAEMARLDQALQRGFDALNAEPLHFEDQADCRRLADYKSNVSIRHGWVKLALSKGLETVAIAIEVVADATTGAASAGSPKASSHAKVLADLDNETRDVVVSVVRAIASRGDKPWVGSASVPANRNE